MRKIYKSVCKALLMAIIAGLQAQKTQTIDDLLGMIPFYCILKHLCRFLKFIQSLHTEPCRSRAEILRKAILDAIKAKTAKSIETIILEILATHGLNLKPIWYLIKPVICAFIKSIREDIRRGD